MMKYLLLGCFLVFSGAFAQAKEAFSYLYIQGDKQTPFYVKLEDAMQPRYGKNYCIVPQLAAGAAHIEILFQQNAFPAQQFTVMIPESGSRGFLLVKKDEGFSLYDLQQGFYLSAGNTEEDDKLPNTITAFATQTEPVIKTPAPPAEKTETPAQTDTEPEKQGAVEKAETEAMKPPPTKGEPAFIPNLELPQTGKAAVTNNAPTNIPRTELPAITNSDCPSAISKEDFSKTFGAMSAASGDEDRLAFVLGKMDVCYESWMARALAQMLSTESGRFTLLKKIYPHISDQGAFPLLDDLFSSDVWKAQFTQLVRR